MVCLAMDYTPTSLIFPCNEPLFCSPHFFFIWQASSFNPYQKWNSQRHANEARDHYKWTNKYIAQHNSIYSALSTSFIEVEYEMFSFHAYVTIDGIPQPIYVLNPPHEDWQFHSQLSTALKEWGEAWKMFNLVCLCCTASKAVSSSNSR